MAEVDTKKQQMEFILVGALVLVALFIGIAKFKKKEKDDEVFSRAEFSEKWKEIEILEVKLPEEELPIEYTTGGERSPFKSMLEDIEKIKLAGEDVKLPAMSFQGMVWNSKRPQAVINNKVYDIGDKIMVGSQEAGTEDEIELVDITSEGIHLRYRYKEFIVRPKTGLEQKEEGEKNE